MSENQFAVLIGIIILAVYLLNRYFNGRFEVQDEKRRLTLHNLAITQPGRTFSAVGNPVFAMNMLFDEEADHTTDLLRVENMIQGQIEGIEYELFDLVFLKSRILSFGKWGEKRTGVLRIMLDGKKYPKFLIRPRRLFSRQDLSRQLTKLDLEGHPGLQADIVLYAGQDIRPVKVLNPAVVTFVNHHPDATIIGNENQLGLYLKDPMPATEAGLDSFEKKVLALSQAFDRAMTEG